MGSKTMLFGSEGRLGRTFIKLNPEILGFSRREADITNREQILKLVEKYKPDVIINCAAITDIDFCSTHPQKAWDVNVRGVRNILESAKKYNSLIVHFSSDYVIDPVNEYAWTKLASERLMNDSGLTIRTNMYDEDFWIIRSLASNKKINLLCTQYFNPISTFNLARTVFKLLNKKYVGIINVGTKNKINYYQLGLSIARGFGFDKNLISSAKNIKRDVPRSKNTFLDTKVLKKMGIDVLTIDEDLRLYKNELEKQENIDYSSAPG